MQEAHREDRSVMPLRWLDHLWLWGIPTLLNAVACWFAIPYLHATGIVPIEVSYFLSVGLIVLAPMFFGALRLSAADAGSHTLRDILSRMRVRGMNAGDWVWAVVAFTALSLASYGIAAAVMPRLSISPTPFFFQNMPLDEAHRWILYVWPLFFFFNIFGEEFWWRGYVQPRQELLTKKWTWLVHGLFWAFWHIPMGLDLILAATPIFFVLPAVVQIRRNTTIAIVVHAVFGAFGFLALALGAVH